MRLQCLVIPPPRCALADLLNPWKPPLAHVEEPYQMTGLTTQQSPSPQLPVPSRSLPIISDLHFPPSSPILPQSSPLSRHSSVSPSSTHENEIHDSSCRESDDDATEIVIEKTELLPSAFAILMGNRSTSERKKKRKSDTAPRVPKRGKALESERGAHTKIGSSRATVAEWELRRQVASGEFQLNEKRWETFKNKCSQICDRAGFNPRDPVRVHCGMCGAKPKMKTLYNVARFRDHVDGCTGRGVPSLEGLAEEAGWEFVKTKTTERIVERGCPGLTEKDDPQIPVYLLRPGGNGGGEKSVTVVAKNLFKKPFRELSKKKKDEVLAVQESGHRWQNDRKHKLVCAVDCCRVVKARDGEAPRPCDRCASLLRLQAFIHALKKPLPLDENYVYTNARYQDESIAMLYSKIQGLQEIMESSKDGSPFVRYATGVASGRYHDNKILSGLVQCVLQQNERELNNKGMQNSRYPAEYDNFLHVIAIESPRAYETLSKHLPARSQ